MQDSQQIVKNIKNLLDKYNFIDSDNKLVLMYLREYHKLRFDSKYISTSDLLGIDIKLIQQILDAKYLLKLMEEESG